MPDSVLGAGEPAEDERHRNPCPHGGFIGGGGGTGERKRIGKNTEVKEVLSMTQFKFLWYILSF